MEGLKNVETGKLIESAVALDRSMKSFKKELDSIKAELTARGNRILDDRNIKSVKFYAPDGSAAVTESQKLDIIRADGLKELLTPDVWKSKVKETTETSYKLNPRLERMLKALFTEEYTFEQSLGEFLDEAFAGRLDSKGKAILLKKLKGDFEADRTLLCDVLGVNPETAGEDLFEVELMYIYRIKNAELIRMFLPEEGIDHMIEEIRKCMIVDTKLSITIDYEG